ncbi:MAG: 3-phosphoshikimate 1-carboxyvinyltransferase, partial [Clostridia bacterium]|nr:3-phosphoshikimate 1-carboxyvinyltransferase [Clostridia bacterium]
GRYTLTCSEQMKKRPVSSLIKTLEELGAKFTFLEEQNSYPFIIEGTDSPKTELTVNIDESSQFLSALLICGICANAPLNIRAEGKHSLGYVNMTLDMMWSFGVTAEEITGGYRVFGNYSAKKYEIEPDVSAACYFYAANRLLGTNICVKGLLPHSMQGDIKFAELIKNINGGTVDCSGFSDQTLTLAAIAPFFKNPTKICNVAHIRKQECDRIKAIVENLTAMGVKVEEFADGVKIYPASPKPAKIKTYGDHRVAMSFALTGLRADGIEIENAEVCSKTFKDFFTVLDGICAELCK